MKIERPYVICHMGSTVNGRIIGENWGENWDKYGILYEECHNSFESQAWMVGRVTMEKDFTDGRKPERIKAGGQIPRKAFIGDKDATSFAVAVDARGKLGWSENNINGDHIIEVLSEYVRDDYLQYLRNKKISYIFAGKENLNFEIALRQLHDQFEIKVLMLEGGGHINGSLLNAGLIDELSLLILPLADGTVGTPTTFEISKDLPLKPSHALKLIDVQKLDLDVLWLRYKFQVTMLLR